MNLICTLAKYAIIVLMAMYTFTCFSVFGYQNLEKQKRMLFRQRLIMLLVNSGCFMVLYLQSRELKYIMLYGVLMLFLCATMFLYIKCYPKISRLLLNNMCMLIGLGIMMISRLNYSQSVKQFFIAVCSMVLSLFIPVIIRKAKFLSHQSLGKIYGGIGVIALLGVAILGTTSYGAKLGFTIAGISFQPSELVKIFFVFFVASSLYHAKNFKQIVITTVIAALHVLVLVASTDLGAAVILFVVYLVMLYVSSKQILYIVAGVGAGGLASMVAYQLFAHIRVRVLAWRDPFSAFDGGGYQIAQSLFAIGTGGWLGMGLLEGAPNSIPVAAEDFIFAAISEELGIIFGLCLILVYVSCYIMFLNIAMQIKNKFYKLVALGLGTSYIFQVFLTIGGVIKFIPSTGVTLPLVSYGGSSVLSTLIMFAIIQGLYILREDEEDEIERNREQLIPGKRASQAKNARGGQASKRRDR